jgi:heme-degrading monooxygenase HmoA
MIAKTPKPPYYAVIFTSLRTPGDNGYNKIADEIEKSVIDQPGFLGFESARDGLGITVSYWSDEESIRSWKENLLHSKARNLGREKWYAEFKVRVAKVERDYGFSAE